MPQNLLETAPELDSYLTTLGKELKTLPLDERDAAQIELRQHLESLVAAEVELGTPPAQAVDAALRTFGDARTLGKTLRQTWDERLMPPDLHVDLSRYVLLTMFPAQWLLLFFSGSPGGLWASIAVVLIIAAIFGANLGRRHPALGSTTVFVFNLAYLTSVPFLPWLMDGVRVLGWSSSMALPLMFFLPSIVAALAAHGYVVYRAGKWVAYPWRNFRYLPVQAYLMVTRRKADTDAAAFYRQMLRW